MIRFCGSENQNYWHLMCIQTASWGLPGLMSVTLMNAYGPGAVFFSSLIANLFLWLIGFAIVSMAFNERRNAIENAEAYIGKFGASIAALISIFVFPVWGVVQLIDSTTSSVTVIYGKSNGHELTTIVYGLALGLLVSFLALGKLIRVIKKLNVFLFPVVIMFFLAGMIFSNISLKSKINLEISWPCVLVFISAGFSGMVNLPTFFRHARSKYDCYIALTLISIVFAFFEISSMWINPNALSGMVLKTSTNPSYFLSMLSKSFDLIISAIFLISANLVNIYFAYPSLKLVIPKIDKYPKYFIIGLLITAIYLLLTIYPNLYPSMEGFLYVSDDITANLGISLMFIFLVRIIVKHRPRTFEKLISTTAWIVGSIITVYTTVQNSKTAMIYGIGATTLFYLIFFFIEEPFWCIKKLRQLKDETNASD